MQSRNRQRGVTLMELMITLAIISILITVVAPNVGELLTRNRITAQVNEISGVIQLGRNTAIDEQSITIVCPTTDFSSCSNNWELAKMVFIDLDQSGTRSDDEEILAGTSISPSGLNISGPAVPIQFNGNGTASAAATVLICDEDNTDKFARALMVSLQGRVKLSQDSDNNDIHEDNEGTPLSCS
ncbi:GspH/FimT family pseudopilin [Lacimicrobium alkaliphilum]|uniref:Type II secretion system protein H n=1 Tax=Lacimicrobium alkaliphilum TaxID=1526571 RepID=A0ABQ1RGH8_9ALTE|nr:GspH/FimT family pseudopilin [Lacimicrobium alkaliphilum]GGD66335.1 type IV pilus biogenesis protein FimU [Lacimicrobium alkaliphilum]